jgi:membrane protease YdiL (CAAX protease family)
MYEEIRNALFRVIPFLLAILVIRNAIQRNKFSKEDLHLRKPINFMHFFTWWLLFLLLIILIEISLYSVNLLEASPWKHNIPSSIIQITGIVILAPVAEELLFRGILLFKLEQWKVKRIRAIMIQAIAFTAMHSFAYENTLSSNIGIIQTFADACIYAYAKYNSQSIYTPIAMHATGNLIAILERFIL